MDDRKKYDSKKRWRSKNINFRMSPEEAELLNRYVALSGMCKCEYLAARALGREIIVRTSPRVQKAMRAILEQVLTELKRLNKIENDNDELLNTINFVCSILLQTNGTEKKRRGDPSAY